jgi:hypothetical protein
MTYLVMTKVIRSVGSFIKVDSYLSRCSGSQLGPKSKSDDKTMDLLPGPLQTTDYRFNATQI